MPEVRPAAWVLPLLLCGPVAAGAAEPAPDLAVRRAPGEIRLDGDLSDPGWRDAAVLDQYWETQPGDNVPPRVKTTAWVTYDDRSLYIALRCEDPEPSRVRAPFVERDAIVGTDDNVAVFLDTRGDGLTAVELRVNPRGQQADAVMNDASQNEDFSPDFFYDTAARVTSFGWAAEMRVPFSSLRYPRRDVQAWRILVWRNYPRDYRYFIHSRPIPRGSDCLVCHAQPMSGLVGLPVSGGLVVAPYASGQEVATAASPGEPLGEAERTGDVGVDVKWQPSAGNAIDATVNPDFSQVESDVAQIAVNNRFALFFPEKRPFFMEGVELFDTPIQAVYTRTLTSPRWGGRATGRAGSSSYAVLVGDDRGGGSVVLPGPSASDLASQDFGSLVGIARFRQGMGGDSYAGALFTGRQVDGGGYNRVFGPDVQWRLSPKDRLSAQLLWSETETPDRPDLAAEWDGRRLSGHGLDASWSHQERRPIWTLRYRDFGDGFRADTGFVPQVGYREGQATLGWNLYSGGLVTQAQPRLVAAYAEDRQGAVLERRVEPGFFALGSRDLQAMASLRFQTERTGDRLLSTTSLELLAQVDPSRSIARVGLQGSVGEAVDLYNVQVGSGADLQAFATLRPWSRLTLDLLAARRWLDVPRPGGGSGRLFTAEVLRARTLLHLSSRAYLRLIGQWVATTSDPALFPSPVDPKEGGFEGSALFTYKINWQTALYVGYGDQRSLDEGDVLRRTSRQLFAKVSYALQL
jgi:hypothetical protein